MERNGQSRRKYGALFVKETTGYSVVLVDYNWYNHASCGETLEDARNMAKELVELSAKSREAKGPLFLSKK